jgi:hypothetical protein
LYITITYHAPPSTILSSPYSVTHPSSLPYIHLLLFQFGLHIAGPCRYLSHTVSSITHTTHTSPIPAPDWPYLALSNHDVPSDDRHTVPTSWISRLHFDTQGIKQNSHKNCFLKPVDPTSTQLCLARDSIVNRDSSSPPLESSHIPHNRFDGLVIRRQTPFLLRAQPINISSIHEYLSINTIFIFIFTNSTIKDGIRRRANIHHGSPEVHASHRATSRSL